MFYFIMSRLGQRANLIYVMTLLFRTIAAVCHFSESSYTVERVRKKGILYAIMLSGKAFRKGTSKKYSIYFNFPNSDEGRKIIFSFE